MQSLSTLWAAISAFVAAHPALFVALMWTPFTALVTSVFRPRAEIELTTMPAWKRLVFEAVNLCAHAGVNAPMVLALVKRNLPPAWFVTGALALVSLDLGGCSLFRSDLAKQLEKEAADYACIIGAAEASQTLNVDPQMQQAIAQFCQVSVDTVISALAKHKAEKKAARMAFARDASVSDAGADQ